MDLLIIKKIQITIKNWGLKIFIKKAIKKVMIYSTNKFLDISGIGKIVAFFAVKKLKNHIKRAKNFEELVDIAFNFRFFGVRIRPMQSRFEIQTLLEYLLKLKPKNILEIGTANGGTLFLFTNLAERDGKIISIDLPFGFWGGYPNWRIQLYKSFANDDKKMYLLKADSHMKDTLEMVSKILKDEKLDFLFIDGDHSYGGVKKDFEMYSPLVRKGGIIAFHDIFTFLPGECEVGYFWREVKEKFKSFEIVDNYEKKGIGIIEV